MEAVWTRFFPLTYALQDVIFKEGAVGELRRVVSDFSIDFVDSEWLSSSGDMVVVMTKL